MLFSRRAIRAGTAPVRGGRSRLAATLPLSLGGLLLALLPVLAVLPALLAGELLWRFLRPRLPGVASNPVPMLYDEHLGWRYRPGVRVRHLGAGFDVEVRIDGQGRRAGRAPGRAGAAGPRAVFAGDSLTFGWGVEEEESFPGLLRDRLGLDAVNLGVAGYGTDQSYLRLRREGLPLGPALAVYTYCGNDLREILDDSRYGRAKPWFRLQGERLVGLPPRPSFLERRSVLYHSAASLLARHEEPPTPAEAAAARRLAIRLVAAMAGETRRAGGTFALVHSDEPWLGRAFDGAGGAALVIDVGPAFARARREQGPVGFAADPHWNRLGHRVVAAEVARALRAALPALRHGASPAGSVALRAGSVLSPDRSALPRVRSVPSRPAAEILPESSQSRAALPPGRRSSGAPSFSVLGQREGGGALPRGA